MTKGGTAVLALAIVGLAQPAAAQSGNAPSDAPARRVSTQTADGRLKALYDAEWAWRSQELALDPGGGRAGIGRLPRVDAASQQRRLAYWEKTLAELDRIPIDELSSEEQINAAVFRTSLEEFVSQLRSREYEAPVSSGGSFWLRMAPRAGFGTREEYRAYLGRLRDMPRYVDEQMANMRAGLKRGFTPPQVTLQGRERTIAPLAAPDVAGNPLFTPFGTMPTNITVAEQQRLRSEAAELIAEGAAPAFARLHAFVRDEYIPAARKTIAAKALPGGAGYYQAKIREFTTLDLTADQIHQIGLKEVARINAEMKATMRKTGWKGSYPDFLKFLKTDPQFYAKTPYELIARSTYIANKVNGKLRETIGLLPRYRFTVLPTPAAIAPFATGGNGGLESCVINTYNLPARPLYTLAALTVHECAPGHSFQAALALEGPNRPALRKGTSFTGYGEGWGLYTEWLGIGMGVYETPYDDFGRLTYEMWRAARLVIDTGLHHKGWSRQRAIDYLSSHTALSDHEVTIEVDRYISGPGQALAYKLGEMLIRRKRADAEAKLGTAFDQRWFHDVILSLGSVPLPVLEQEIDRWIAGGGKNPYGGPA
jgi:uncharacterized protein (DUF885 family)